MKRNLFHHRIKSPPTTIMDELEKDVGRTLTWRQVRRAGWEMLALVVVLVLVGKWWSITLAIPFAVFAGTWLVMARLMRQEIEKAMFNGKPRLHKEK